MRGGFRLGCAGGLVAIAILLSVGGTLDRAQPSGCL